jgi:hypothetical protein
VLVLGDRHRVRVSQASHFSEVAKGQDMRFLQTAAACSAFPPRETQALGSALWRRGE